MYNTYFFLAKCKLQVELNEVCRLHESLKIKYLSTLYDSRCFIFGVNASNCPEFSTPSNFKSRDVYYASDNDPNPSIEMHLNEFLLSLFWVLDAKRLEKSKEKVLNFQKVKFILLGTNKYFLLK